MDGSRRGGSFWASKSGIALCALIAGAALFLIVEHRAHALEWLPFAILLACPLMHLFMHRGHGDHTGHSHGGNEPRNPRDPGDDAPGAGRGA